MNLSIVTDNQKIMACTKQPDIYFTCRKLYFEAINMYRHSGLLPEAMVTYAYAHDYLDVNEFVERYWQDTQEQVKHMKSNQDIEALYNHFYKKLDSYEYLMPKESKDMIRKKYMNERTNNTLVNQ